MTTREQLADIEDEIRNLASRKSLDEQQERKLKALRQQFATLHEIRKQEDRAALAELVESGNVTIESGVTIHPDRQEL